MWINKDSVLTIPGLLIFLIAARSLLKIGLGNDSSVPDFLTIIAAVAPFAITEIKSIPIENHNTYDHKLHITKWSYKVSLIFYMVCALTIFLITVMSNQSFQVFEDSLISSGHINVDDKGSASLQIFFAGWSLFLFLIPLLSLVSMRIGYKSEKIYFSLFFVGIILVLLTYTLSNLVVEIGNGSISFERLMSGVFNVSPDLGTQFPYDKWMFMVFQFLMMLSLVGLLSLHSWICAYLGRWLGKIGIIFL